jgi:hypothetical protein
VSEQEANVEDNQENNEERPANVEAQAGNLHEHEANSFCELLNEDGDC